MNRLENVANFTEFVKAFSQFGSEMVELAHLTGDRQNVCQSNCMPHIQWHHLQLTQLYNTNTNLYQHFYENAIFGHSGLLKVTNGQFPLLVLIG